MLSGSREVQASGPVKEDTVIGPKIAAVERREARVPGNNGTRHLQKVPDEDLSAFRRSAPLTHVREKGKEGGAPRLTNQGADESRLYQYGCLCGAV